MKEKRRWSWREITLIIAISVGVVAAIIAPAYFIQQQRANTDRIITQLQVESQSRLEQAILVNTFTISCLLAIPIEDRSNTLMRDCISDGFEQAPSLDQPDVTIP